MTLEEKVLIICLMISFTIGTIVATCPTLLDIYDRYISIFF